MELLNDRFRKANLQVGTLNNQQCHKLYLDVIQLLVAREKFFISQLAVKCFLEVGG